MTFRVEITPNALKQVVKRDRTVRPGIVRFLKRGLDRDNPRSQGRALVGQAFWRYRVGDHRILAVTGGDVLLVLIIHVEHHRSAYQTVNTTRE